MTQSGHLHPSRVAVWASTMPRSGLGVIVKRRDFISLVGGIVAWPLATQAQTGMPVIGMLSSASRGVQANFLARFIKGLVRRASLKVKP